MAQGRGTRLCGFHVGQSLIFEQNEKTTFPGAWRFYSKHFDIDATYLITIAQTHAFATHRLGGSTDLCDGAAEFKKKSFARHFQQIRSGFARRRFEVRAGPAAILNNV